ncbi:MAG: histone deacetylase family protein, partial [Candidatus Heimdallarchaeota archaeon]|nr:histone deacetylase family protein [Candidatus Heimdallarchaeota archaeon]
NSYDMTPAGKGGRLDPVYALLKEKRNDEFIVPQPAILEHLQYAHSQQYIDSLMKSSEAKELKKYNMAILSAGGAIKCAQLIQEGEPSFGLIRPPGHHASYNSAWGFCYFNNLAISLLYLRHHSDIKRAFVLDFDLHQGDGNINILQRFPGYEIYNPDANSEEEYLDRIQNGLKIAKECDIIVASAGFDQGKDDWGQLVSVEGYTKIGQLMKEFALEKCEGRRYALLEGGYNPSNMAENILGFLKGFE